MRRWIGPVTRYVVYAACAAFVLNRALISQQETRRLIRERQKLEAEVVRLRRENHQRERICRALLSDAFYVELLLRERHGYRRPGEPRPVDSAAQPEHRGAAAGFSIADRRPRPSDMSSDAGMRRVRTR